MNGNKNKSSIGTILVLLFIFGGPIAPLLVLGLVLYLLFRSPKYKSETFTSEFKSDAYKNVGKPKINGGVNIKSTSNKVDYGTKFETKNYDYTVKEKKTEIGQTIYRPNLSSNYNNSNFNTLDNYSRLIRGMNPQELLELIDAFYDEFTHNIYHEASNTAHITNGVALVHNATKKKWYSIHSTDLLHKTKKMFDGTTKNELYHEYQSGDTIWIKLLPLHGSPYSSLYSMDHDIVSKYNAKRL